MQFLPIKTRIFQPPKDDIFDLINHSVLDVHENDILIITSKIVAIHQGRCVKKTDIKDKQELIIHEAEKYIPQQKNDNKLLLTLKLHTLIPFSGIDESNAGEYYILWPENVNEIAKEICLYLKKKYHIKNLAVIITDSHCIPLRRGVIDISIGFFGLNPIIDYRGKRDLFNREIEISQSNIVDSLSAASGLIMGEGTEQTPMVLVRNASFVTFTEKDTYDELIISEEEDIYKPLLKDFIAKK